MQADIKDAFDPLKSLRSYPEQIVAQQKMQALRQSWSTRAVAIPLAQMLKVMRLARSQTMKNEGLLPRYEITKKDGLPFSPDKEVIVIEISDPDPREFLAAYQFSVICRRTGYVELANDIIKKLFGDADTVAYVASDFCLDQGPMTISVAEKLVEELKANNIWAMYYTRTVIESTFI